MILPFAESWFVVTFSGEGPESKLIQGWENVLNHIDEQLGNSDPDANTGWSVRDEDCDLHDIDNWGTLDNHYIGNDDERHTFEQSEFAYCVGLQIVRVTEPVVPAATAALELVLSWMTNVNVAEATEVASQCVTALTALGYDKGKLDDIALGLLHGACRIT